MFETMAEDNHGFSNRATWLAALWYLDVLENLQLLSFKDDDKAQFEDGGDIRVFLEDEFDDWAESTTVSAAHIEKAELYYTLDEVNYDELIAHLTTYDEYKTEREKKTND